MMVNSTIRNAIQNYCRELELEEVDIPLLLDTGYDNSIIGITEDHRVVYSYDSMVDELMKDNGWSAEEAIEWIAYNTLRALPYCNNKGKKPIIMFMATDELVERYDYKED